MFLGVSEIFAYGVALFYTAFPKVLAGHFFYRRHYDNGATSIFIMIGNVSKLFQ